MATPTVQYLLNEASSGTTPTTVNDTAPGTAVNLTAAFGTGSWTSIPAGDGIHFNASATVTKTNLAGTKVQTQFAGQQKATGEMVLNSSDPGSSVTAVYFGDASLGGSLMWVLLSNSAASIECNCAQGQYQFSYTPGSAVWHFVFDSTAVAGQRIRAYQNGVQITAGNVIVLAEVTANAAIDSVASTWSNNQIQFGAAAGLFKILADLYYVTFYPTDIGAATIAANAAALAANNDADPNAGSGGVNVAWLRA